MEPGHQCRKDSENPIRFSAALLECPGSPFVMLWTAPPPGPLGNLIANYCSGYLLNRDYSGRSTPLFSAVTARRSPRLVQGLCADPKHAGDQNTQRDVIESMTENVTIVGALGYGYGSYDYGYTAAPLYDYAGPPSPAPIHAAPPGYGPLVYSPHYRRSVLRFAEPPLTQCYVVEHRAHPARGARVSVRPSEH